MEREKCCCFTGHRRIPEQEMLWVRRRLREEILDLAQKGVDTFLTGGALGFDTLAAQEVLRMRAMGLPFRWLNFSLLVAAFALAVGFGFFLIFLFGVFRLQWDEVLLWNWQELSQVPQGVFTAGGTVAAGGYVLFLLGDVRPEEVLAQSEEKSRGTVMRRLGGLFLLLGAGMLLVLGRLGADLAAQINRPFFQMVSGLGFEGAFQRLEELASALWVLGDAALLGLLLLCLRRLAAQLLGRKESKKQGWGITGVVLLGSIPIAYWNQIIAGNLLPMGNLAALAISVLCMCLVRKQSKNLKKIEKRG